MPIDVNAIVLIILSSLVLASLPFYPYSRHWGYAPSALLALLLLVMLVIAFT